MQVIPKLNLTLVLYFQCCNFSVSFIVLSPSLQPTIPHCDNRFLNLSVKISLINHNSFIVQCRLCHKWFHFICTQLSKERRPHGPAIVVVLGPQLPELASLVSVKVLRTLWQTLPVMGGRKQSDRAANLCPNLSQTTNYPTQNTQKPTHNDRQSFYFWNNIPPSAPDKLPIFVLKLYTRNRSSSDSISAKTANPLSNRLMKLCDH